MELHCILLKLYLLCWSSNVSPLRHLSNSIWIGQISRFKLQLKVRVRLEHHSNLCIILHGVFTKLKQINIHFHAVWDLFHRFYSVLNSFFYYLNYIFIYVECQFICSIFVTQSIKCSKRIRILKFLRFQ